MRKKLLVLALPLLLLVAGCAHNISQQSLAMADRTITFSKLQENPDAYRGKFVVLGGLVVGATRSQGGTEYEVLQYNLDSRETPDETSASGGRFLADVPDSLKIAPCKKGTLVSMAGEVTGKLVEPLKGVDYTYPVIAVKELHIVRVPDDDFFRTWNPYAP